MTKLNSYNYLHNDFGIANEVLELCQKAEWAVLELFSKIDENAEYNQLKILKAFQKNRLSEAHFASTTGYGYNDLGRETLEAIYADTFHTEAAMVRNVSA